MALLGQRNQLPVLRTAPQGYYLDGGTHGDIMLPIRQVPRGLIPGGLVDVFVYRDSDDRLIATTRAPFASVGDFAALRVVAVNPRIGAFLDWGLEKDLLLPLREQAGPVSVNALVVVHIVVDERTDRIVASARLDRHLSEKPAAYTEGQAVKLLIAAETPLGYKAIIENAHAGLLYRSEMAGPLMIGQSIDGFVRTVRPDGKIDLALDRAGYQRIAPLTEQILAALREAGGSLPFHDGSEPDAIREKFGVSKKAFKQAIGALFRERKIRIEAIGIALSQGSSPPAPPPAEPRATPPRATRPFRS